MASSTRSPLPRSPASTGPCARRSAAGWSGRYRRRPAWCGTTRPCSSTRRPVSARCRGRPRAGWVALAPAPHRAGRRVGTAWVPPTSMGP